MKKLMKSILFAATTLCAAIIFFASTAQAETTQCTPITTIPTTITAQGIYCLNGNLAGNLASGNAITINTNNVTIDFNGYKLGNLAAGASTGAYGIYAFQKKNITIRNGTIRGFIIGIALEGSPPYSTSSGHLIENVRLDGNTAIGIVVRGVGNTIRNNQVVSTGGTTNAGTTYGIIAYGPGARVLNNDVIDVAATTSTAYGIYISYADGAVVEGNRISNVISTSGGTIGIYILHSPNTTVSDNRMAGVPNNGIYYSGTSTGIYMNNTVSGATTPFSGGFAAGTTNYSN